jgi:hypothetical protein
MLDVGDPLKIMLRASGCYSSSCTETMIGECAVESRGAGEYQVVSGQICVNVDSSGDCTDDCGGAGTPTCEAETLLEPGTNTVRYSNFLIRVEVPGALSETECVGYRE